MNQTANKSRRLAVSFSTRGFGYAVIEGENTFLDFGRKRIDRNKNACAFASVKQLIIRYQPDLLVLQDVNQAKGTRRVNRIKKLNQKVVALAKRRKIKVQKISGKSVRAALLGNENGTKQEMAELLAKQYPEELAIRLPPKRKAWKSADARMDIFDAVGLAVVSGKVEKRKLELV